MGWSWSDVYPRHRVLTVILAPGDAETFLAMPGVRIIGDHVALVEAFNTPLTAASKPSETTDDRENLKGVSVHIQTPDRRPPSKTVVKAVRPIIVAAAQQMKAEEVAVASTPVPKPKKAPAKRRQLPSRPPRQPERPPSSVSVHDLALVEEAIASGKVTVTTCPPCKGTPEDEIVPLNEHARMRKHRMARRKARLEREKVQQAAKGG